MSLRTRFGRQLLLLTAASTFGVACGNDGGTDPGTGSLAVLVTGLPSTASAGITVSGPDGFSRVVNASDTLEGVVPGKYVVTSAGITTSVGAKFGTSVAAQEVVVSKGAVASASVAFTASTGSLRVQTTGLPAGARPYIEVRSLATFASVTTVDSTLHGLEPGTYTVTAQPVDAAGERWSGNPRDRVVTITTAEAPVQAPVTYTVSRTNLMIAGAYITQSVQRVDGSVPLVQGRNGMIRVFVTADETNALKPSVRVRLFRDGTTIYDQTAAPAASGVQLTPWPDLSSYSVNLPVSGLLIQPGVSMVVELDPANAIAEGNEADNRMPAEGERALDVRVTPPLRVLVVPLYDSTGNLLGNPGNVDTLISQSVKMFPVGASDVVVRSQPFTIPKPLLASSSQVNEGWGPALSNLRAARIAEGNGGNADYASRIWYGIAHVTYTSGIAGLGYIGYPTSIGWDHASGNTSSSGSASSVMAHELGHNFGRVHAPCGNAGNPDPNYPSEYSGGITGQAGYDIFTGQILPSSRADLMGYCNSIWISDYTYNGVLSFRASYGYSVQTAGMSARTVQPTLLVWGRVSQAGEVTLNPAFEISTRPSLPERSGSHLVRGLAADGRVLFSYSFEPDRVADMPNADRDFAFAVPMTPEVKSQLASIVVTGRNGRQARASSRASALSNARVRAERITGGRTRVRWEAGAMVMVRDAATGQVLAFARGQSLPMRTTARELEVVVSDGVRSVTSRVRAAQ